MSKQFYHNLMSGLLILFALTIIYSCARNPVTGKKEIMLVSEAQELQMGLQSDPGIIAHYGLYQDSIMQKFINEKGKEMGKISHRPDLDYQFRILDSPVVNAFAVPGGFVYFTRGIMAHFNNEAEFAGVLGHEIGHITARHSASQMSKQQLYGGLFMVGMIVSEELRSFGQAAQQGLGLLFLKFGRDDESQSDELGVDYSTQVGYDAHEMANFFGVLSRLQKEAGVNIPEWQSTHPDPANRFQKVHQMADEYQAADSKTNYVINRNQYLGMIDGIVFGEDPRQGYVENNNFYHPTLKFQFPVPQGWQIVNSPQMVQMGEPNGKAMMMLTLAQGNSLDAAAQATVEQDQLTVVESAKVNVNGLPAIAMISEQKSQNPNTGAEQVIRVITYIIEYEGLYYKFHGLSLAADFNGFYNTFSNTMTNFRTLFDPTKINRLPDIIQIQTAQGNATLGQLLQQSGVNDQKQLNKIAALNNMQLNTTLPAGTRYKMLTKGTGPKG